MVTKRGLAGARGPLFIIGFLCLIFVVIAFNFLYQPPRYTVGLITKDLDSLQKIFENIDEKCRIMGFEHQKNEINFLNVGSFSGSSIGPMHLAYPKQWEGPYVKDNPTFEGIEYQIVRTHQGLFIAPGEGAHLPNGKIIGTDIHLDEKADIEKMITDENSLMYQKHPLAIALPLQMNALQRVLTKEVIDDDMIS
jgi:hypothetical protein